MNINAGLQGLLLVGVLGLNVQISMLSGLSGGTPNAAPPAAGVAEVQPAINADLQAELERLRAENVTLQVIVKHATFSKVVDTPAPAPTMLAPAPPLSWASLPPFPEIPATPAKPERSSGGKVVATAEKADPAKVDAAKTDSGPAKKAPVVFRPIRMRDDGGLLYLASDGNIRVVRSGGQLYGMNGRFIESDGRKAVFELAGRTVPLPLIGE